MNPSRRNFITQIIIVSIVCITAIVLALIFIPRTAPAAQRRITLRVESTSGTATIQYNIQSSTQTNPDKTFSTPWEKSWDLKRGTQITLTAGNPQQTGKIKCILKMDGKEWKSNIATMPVDKVACAGIVP